MLCQICQTRSATVHQTQIVGPPGQQTRAERHLCEVCAGIKTEPQMEEEQKAKQKEWKAASERRLEQSQALLASYLLGSGLPPEDRFRFQPGKM